MAKKIPSPQLLADAEAFIRKVTDRWAADGQQVTPEHVIKEAAMKAALAVML